MKFVKRCSNCLGNFVVNEDNIAVGCNNVFLVIDEENRDRVTVMCRCPKCRQTIYLTEQEINNFSLDDLRSSVIDDDIFELLERIWNLEQEKSDLLKQLREVKKERRELKEEIEFLLPSSSINPNDNSNRLLKKMY